MATGAIAPPRLANVFMQPVTVPADSRPISRHTDQAALIHKSAIPAAAAIKSAAISELLITAATARIKPLPMSAIDATPHRPILSPYRLTQWSVQNPPTILAPAPLKRTSDASRLAWLAENPRASRRYVCNQVR